MGKVQVYLIIIIWAKVVGLDTLLTRIIGILRSQKKKRSKNVGAVNCSLYVFLKQQALRREGSICYKIKFKNRAIRGNILGMEETKEVMCPFCSRPHPE
jgi:hypothetical protein